MLTLEKKNRVKVSTTAHSFPLTSLQLTFSLKINRNNCDMSINLSLVKVKVTRNRISTIVTNQSDAQECKAKLADNDAQMNFEDNINDRNLVEVVNKSDCSEGKNREMTNV